VSDTNVRVSGVAAFVEQHDRTYRIVQRDRLELRAR
jgi:hypothetical protein